jgi:hypothetical protein
VAVSRAEAAWLLVPEVRILDTHWNLELDLYYHLSYLYLIACL